MCVIDWEAVAAWVQAIFSVVAIGVAIWLGERQVTRTNAFAEAERKRQAAIIASGLATALYELRIDVEARAKRLALLSDSMPTGNFVLSNPEGQVETLRLHPPTLDSMLSWTAVLDREAAQLALLSTQAAHTLNEAIVSVLYSFKPGITGPAAKAGIEKLLIDLKILSKQLERSLDLLSPIHGMERKRQVVDPNPPAP